MSKQYQKISVDDLLHETAKEGNDLRKIILRLRAENERLRAALVRISSGDWAMTSNPDIMRDIAKKALEGS